MVKINSGECIWEFAQKMQNSDMGLPQNSRKPKKTKKQKKQCFQNYSDLWTSCQIFVFFVFFGFLEFFFSDGAVVKCTDEKGVHEIDAWL